MSVVNSCIEICAELRRKGFDERSNQTSIIPEDAVINAVKDQKWSRINQLRYLGVSGYLVDFEFLEVVGEGEFRLTGADLDE